MSHLIRPRAFWLCAPLLLLAGCAQPAAIALSPGNAQPAKATVAGRAMNVLHTEHFQMIYGADRDWASETGQLAEGIYQEFHRSFARAGFKLTAVGQPLVWLCFGDRGEFESYSRQVDRTSAAGIHGYYSLRTNMVAVAQLAKGRTAAAPARPAAEQPVDQGQEHASFVVPEGVSGGIETARTLHEAAHQLSFNCGVQKRGVPYPLWVSEGLAMQFEPDAGGAVGLGRDNPDRRVGLLLMRFRGRLMPLRDLVRLIENSPSTGRNDRELYAQSWGFFKFLMQTRPTQMKAYLQSMAELPPGRAAVSALNDRFVRAFGRPDSLEPDWARFLDSLPTDTAGCTSRPTAPSPSRER